VEIVADGFIRVEGFNFLGKWKGAPRRFVWAWKLLMFTSVENPGSGKSFLESCNGMVENKLREKERNDDRESVAVLYIDRFDTTEYLDSGI
jgi:hypothetical protein